MTLFDKFDKYDKFDKFDKYVKIQIWKQECKQANLGGWVLGGRSKQVLVTPGGGAAMCATALHCNTTSRGGATGGAALQYCTAPFQLPRVIILIESL